jgi:hypothetical protein
MARGGLLEKASRTRWRVHRQRRPCQTEGRPRVGGLGALSRRPGGKGTVDRDTPRLEAGLGKTQRPVFREGAGDVTMGAGLRPTAKAGDMPPDPTVGAPALYPNREFRFTFLCPSHIRSLHRTPTLNPVAIVIPCHRVVRSNPSLTGYAGGRPRKQWLLRHEGALLRSGTLAGAAVHWPQPRSFVSFSRGRRFESGRLGPRSPTCAPGRWPARRWPSRRRKPGPAGSTSCRGRTRSRAGPPSSPRPGGASSSAGSASWSTRTGR